MDKLDCRRAFKRPPHGSTRSISSAPLVLPSRIRATRRGYRGAMDGVPEAAVEFLSAGEIARHLQSGRIHLGITGEDLIREQIPDADDRVSCLLKLGFGHADVIVAIPDCWLDVETMARSGGGGRAVCH